MASTVSPARARGTAICQYSRTSEAPSMRAASSSSVGTASIVWRIKKTPKALNAAGTMTACRWSSQPKECMSRNNGTSVICAGTINVASTIRNSGRLKRNSNLAKP